mgnify:CR=1 FL=1
MVWFSDVAAIASVAHAHGALLVVDEAHGAHFGFGGGFPQNAIALGADAVIVSLHKTLPAFTQTALLLLGVENWISFNFAKGCEEPERHGVHFFIDDYQFNRVWTSPDVYVEMLGRFQAVCTPDFSTYTDFPKAIQIYNHYRKHWLGAYWQAHGMTVIPTISWSDHDSYEWCFDGEP